MRVDEGRVLVTAMRTGSGPRRQETPVVRLGGTVHEAEERLRCHCLLRVEHKRCGWRVVRAQVWSVAICGADGSKLVCTSKVSKREERNVKEKM